MTSVVSECAGGPVGVDSHSADGIYCDFPLGTAEAALDRLYILRTSLTATDLSTPDVVRVYKHLQQAERAFGH